MGVSANQVTLAALVLSLATGSLILLQPAASWPLLLVPGTLFVRMALNALDGMMAREHDMQTTLGAVLNELGDVLADAALYLPIGMVPGVSGRLVTVVVVLSVVSEMAGVIGVQIGSTRRYDGPMGKSDRALMFGAVALLLGLGVTPGAWLQIVLWGTTLLLVVTIVNRVRRALAEVSP